MKATKLAEKKLSNLIGRNIKKDFETSIRTKLLYDGLDERNGFVMCTLEDIWTIAYRAWYYGINIIGVESDIDQDIPFYVFCQEDFVDEPIVYGEKNPSYWIIGALMEIIIQHPNIHLRFYIEIPQLNTTVLEKVIGRIESTGQAPF